MKHFNSLRPNKETIESIYGDEKQTVPSSGIEAKTNYVVPSGKQDECNVTVFTPGLIIEGNVSSETDMIIRGTISGNIVCRSDINLSGRGPATSGAKMSVSTAGRSKATFNAKRS